MPNKLCKHLTNIQVQADVIGLHDNMQSQAPDHRILRIRARCGECGMPMEFIGVTIDSEAHFDGPATPPDQLSLWVPIRPGATRLFVP